MKRVHALYEGYVQGVGFRFTVRHLAWRLNLVGWVKNLYDGRVELLVEGDEEQLKKMIEQLNQRFEGYIRNSDVEWSDATGEFDSFSIRF